MLCVENMKCLLEQFYLNLISKDLNATATYFFFLYEIYISTEAFPREIQTQHTARVYVGIYSQTGVQNIKFFFMYVFIIQRSSNTF
jgi:hypothetical protein